GEFEHFIEADQRLRIRPLADQAGPHGIVQLRKIISSVHDTFASGERPLTCCGALCNRMAQAAQAPARAGRALATSASLKPSIRLIFFWSAPAATKSSND